MFNVPNKKLQLKKLIETDGLELVTETFAELICQKLPSQKIAYQFILEELDGASKGNEASKAFALNSGIARSEYASALHNSIPEVDGPDGPQQLLLVLSLELANDSDQMASFRCTIDDKIMRRFRFGKYAVETYPKPMSLDKKYSELGAMLLTALNQGQIRIMDQDGAVNMFKETLRKLSPQEIFYCGNSVVCLFTMAHLADSAFQSKNLTTATYVHSKCRPFVKDIIETSKDNYSILEIAMIDAAFDILKKIEGQVRL